MTTRGLLVVAAIFAVAFALLGLGRCGYDRLEVYRTLDTVIEHVRGEYPSVAPVDPGTASLYLEREPPALVIDVRTEEEFAVSHLAGAVHLPTVEAVRDHLASLSPGPDTILLCGALGVRSAELAEELGDVEGARVFHLEGGIFRWANEDRPLVDGDGAPTRLVHPYNRIWGRLLEPDRRTALDGSPEEEPEGGDS